MPITYGVGIGVMSGMEAMSSMHTTVAAFRRAKYK